MRQFLGPIRWEKKAAVFFFGIAFLTVLGPFGTYGALSFWERLVYWTIVMAGVGFFIEILVKTALNAYPGVRVNQFIRIAIGSTLAGLPSAAIVIFVERAFRGLAVNADAVPHLWFKIACIGFAFGAVEFARWGDNAPDQEPAPQRTKLQERLPGERGEIISMSMQDHYVEVTSTGGVDLILMRMSDAIGELDGLPGIRLHRSHWAALAHVAAVEKDGQRWKALLSDGRALPISNTYIGPLRQAFEGKVSSAPRTKIAAGRSRVNTAT